jgi:hypothetical protein
MRASFSYRILLVLLASSSLAVAQVNITTLGIQLKPMIPSKYFGTGTEDAEVEDMFMDTIDGLIQK